MEAPRFACDTMLGGLARWLRFAGFDTLFDPEMSPDQLSARARTEDRWVLTCQRAFPVVKAGPRLMILSRRGLREHTRELVCRLGLMVDERAFFTRCSRCNGSLGEVCRADVQAQVPPFVAAKEERFVRCASCGQIYWPGTHHARIAAKLVELFLDGG
jgi:uncharacterized protein with PIN domain